MISDSIEVNLQAGKGGDGSSSLVKLSSRKIAGGGGDGGRGGDVIFKVDHHLYDLSKFKNKKKFIAGSGFNGRERNKKGKDGDNLVIHIPSGTRIFKEEVLIKDLIDVGSEFLACRGGFGGRGNSKRDYTTPPRDGECCKIALDYRIPNDVVILGFANSGKTSLFNLLTKQERKVAEYPFTTTSCFWAIAKKDFNKITILDTPPIKKTRDAKNTGENKFLRHVLRSKIIILVSCNESESKSEFRSIENEILAYNGGSLKGKNFFYLLSKIDTMNNNTQKGVIPISILEEKGISKLKDNLFKTIL